MRYLAIDPGSHKVGLAVAEKGTDSLAVLFRRVVPLDQLESLLRQLIADYQPDHYLVGGGTGSKALMATLKTWFPHQPWKQVDERETTLLARKRYFEQNPPRGWRRLIPRGLLTPPEPYDDYVAVILIERILEE